MIMQIRHFTNAGLPCTSHNCTVPRILQEYRKIESRLPHDAVVTFIAANGSIVRQDAIRNWYVYTDSAHAPKRYSYLASALKCADVGGVQAVILSCVLFFFWFFSALFKASK